jgi:transposase-like protein
MTHRRNNINDEARQRRLAQQFLNAHESDCTTMQEFADNMGIARHTLHDWVREYHPDWKPLPQLRPPCGWR